MENISEHVRREREARGVTIEELAKGTFISESNSLKAHSI